MRRGRGKGKKQNTAAAAATAGGEEQESGEEEKISPHRRRGRPQKPIRGNDDEEEEEEGGGRGGGGGEGEGEGAAVENIEQSNTKANGSLTSKDLGSQAVAENGRKRKRTVQSKESNGTDDSTKSSVGYRPNGSRRKNKPRRAAEAVVECNGV